MIIIIKILEKTKYSVIAKSHLAELTPTCSKMRFSNTKNW
jgi:hypothetical protein